jgi:membrane-bound lytic murein transglycosylase B
MRKFMRSIVLIIIWLYSLIIPSIPAAENRAESFQIWLDDLKVEAMRRGVSLQTLNSAFDGIEPIPEVIRLDRRQPESDLTLDDYLARVVTMDRIDSGRYRLSRMQDLLKGIEARYGVESGLLVALWGIESDFGRITGKFPTIGSLATLAFDARRSSFFRKELMNALQILDKGYISIDYMKGSWAGAMGQFQFMPSTFYSFGVDFDGDGRIEIWRGGEDLFASSANYLQKSGWKHGGGWGQEVLLPDNFDRSLISKNVRKSQSEWVSLGVRTKAGLKLPPSEKHSYLVQPDGSAGRSFLVYRNYSTILKWNRSDKFAIAVGILYDRIESCMIELANCSDCTNA